MSQRLPIFRDDLSFEDNRLRMLEDMRRKMGRGFESGGSFTHRSPFEDDFSQMCGNFFKLRPRDPLSQVRRNDDMSGSRESLDDGSAKSLFVENPDTKSRVFQISFDVKDYEPNEIAVKVQDDTLLVEARHEKMQDGNKLVTEFNRKIKIPVEVDTEKLSSSLSSDGILSISAPVPPKYHSVTDSGRTHSPGFTPAKSPPISNTQGRNSPSMAHSPGVHSPNTTAQQDRNSPLAAAQTQQPVTEAKTQPIYRKQIYMVPQSHLQNGSPITVQTSIPPNRPKTPPLDTPTFYNTERGCEMVLLLNIGSPYTPEDLLVKVDGKNLIVEAEHEESSNGKKSKSSFSREFALNEQIDPNSVTALLKEGNLKITGLAK